MPPALAILPGACALAVAVAGAHLLPAQQPFAERVARALERSRPALLHHLARADMGELALCCLAACHDGVPADDPVFARALERLSRAELDDTYGLALRLMVMAERPDFARREELAARDAALLRHRQTSGGFSYGDHDGWWDLSNTQYAALGLRAAHALGQPTPESSWRLLWVSVRDMQHDDGGFPYRPGQGRPSAYESMTVAGITVLEIAAQMLGLTGDLRKEHEGHVALGWEWLAAHKDAIGDRRTHNSHYFLYGLERAAILGDRTDVGGLDWYAAGAELLCARQLDGGGWWGQDEARPPAQRSPRGHAVDTSFAILFLRRRFQKVQAPVTGERALFAEALSDPASDAAVRAAAAGDASHGEWAVPRLLPLLRSDIAARRRAAVLALFAITGQNFGIEPWRPPPRDEAAIARAEAWWQARRAGR